MSLRLCFALQTARALVRHPTAVPRPSLWLPKQGCRSGASTLRAAAGPPSEPSELWRPRAFRSGPVTLRRHVRGRTWLSGGPGSATCLVTSAPAGDRCSVLCQCWLRRTVRDAARQRALGPQGTAATPGNAPVPGDPRGEAPLAYKGQREDLGSLRAPGQPAQSQRRAMSEG